MKSHCFHDNEACMQSCSRLRNVLSRYGEKPNKSGVPRRLDRKALCLNGNDRASSSHGAKMLSTRRLLLTELTLPLRNLNCEDCNLQTATRAIAPFLRTKHCHFMWRKAKVSCWIFYVKYVKLFILQSKVCSWNCRMWIGIYQLFTWLRYIIIMWRIINI